jgi:hypothetical protein
MNFYVFNHQHKGKPYFDALRSQGHKPVARIADVALFDRDIYIATPNRTLNNVQVQIDRGSKIVIYPHSALPPWWYDGLVQFSDYIAGVVVIGEGQKATMQVIAPNSNVIVGGWPWCPQLPFQKPEKLKTILFGAIHPSGRKLRPEALRANQDIYHRLKRVARWTGCKVIIRHIHDLNLQGLRPYPRFHFVRGQPDGSTQEIDEADVVIAEGTFMYGAVARGKPTIGINQHLPCRPNKDSNEHIPHKWDQYGPDIAYPINFGTKPLMDLIDDAMSGEQTEWRRRFIGNDLDAVKFCKEMEKVAIDTQY